MIRHFSLRRGTGALAALSLLAVSACSGSPGSATVDPAVDAAAVTAGSDAEAATDSTTQASGVFDPSLVHEFSVEFDEADYDAMMQTYTSTGDKEWISGTVTIDGEVFENVGLKLKGNSSLRGATADTAPETLPWRIRLDKFVDGQELDGHSDFVVRGNASETSLNEAVALDLLEAAGLASEHAVSARFTVNGSAADLRLVLQNLDDDWDEENFDTEGILYKADADGDYSYRGEDPDAYSEAFDVDAGEEDYTPLMEFLDFVNNSTDEEFAAELGERLDVEAFARYLAFEDMIGNFDDIDGPGNNSYLRWEADTGMMTVVAWDHNLAFGVSNGGGQFPGGGGQGEGMMPPGDGEFPEGMTPPGDGEFPEGFEPREGMTPPGDGEFPEGFEPPEQGQAGDRGGFAGGPGGGSNILVERFQANEEFAALYDAALADLRAELVDSGLAQEIIDDLASVLTDEATDLVDADTIASEADSIEAVLDRDDSSSGEQPTEPAGGQTT